MSPLDDQLRAALHGRAELLTPSPDPLAGIEARARGIKRRRTLATATGAALAVAAIAVTIPSLTTGTPRTNPAPHASQGVTSPYTLDPAKPWPYRGDPAVLRHVAAFQTEWEQAHPGSKITPLFGQVYDPSAKAELAFVATGGDGPRYGYISEGPTIRYDVPLTDQTAALTFAVEGDEVRRLIVVAAPGVKKLDYAGDGTTYAPMTSIADGVAITPLEGQLAIDKVRVTAPDGTVLLEGEAPGGPSGPPSTEEPGTPANLLTSWPQRGDPFVGPDQKDLLALFAQAMNRTSETANYRALFTGDTDSGVKYTFGQAWFPGDEQAYTVGLVTGRTDGPEFLHGTPAPSDQHVLAFAITHLPGTVGELLVVIPAPRTTQVMYDDDRAGSYRPAEPAPGLDGIYLIERKASPAGGGSDRLLVLTGNGDPATDTTFEGPVSQLLCLRNAHTDCG